MTASPTNDAPSVLITGTSTGIGRACAVELDRRGFRVFGGVRSEADGRQLVEAASPRTVPVLLDVTDAGAIARAARTVAEQVGPSGLAGLVNNAGITVPFPLEFLPIDQLRRQLEVNVIGLVAVTQAMLPLVRRARGRVVNISSISGRLAAPYLGAYAASKHAVEALSDSLRVEVRRFGIKVSVIEPGDVATPIWQKSRALADRLRDEMTEQAGDDVAASVRDAYADDITAMRAATSRFEAEAMPVGRVVRDVVHALCARRPKTRYPIGARTRAAIFAQRCLPDRMRDWIVCRSLGLK